MASGAKIPSTMKVALVEKVGDPVQVKDIPVPQVGDGEVLVKLECTGVCHTDLHVQLGELKGPLPMTPGHEGVGKVVTLGAGVTSVKVGDRVCTPWLHSACQQCDQCLSGSEASCSKIQCTGFTVAGSFAEYIKFPASYVCRVPEGLSNEQAAPIACAGVTAYKALKVSEVKPGQWMVVVGAAGGLGHVAVQYAKAMGMQVIGVTAGSAKLPFLRSLGCDLALDASTGKINEEIIKVTGGGAHGSLILAPRAESFPEALGYLRPRAVVVCVALPPEAFSLQAAAFVPKCITFRGSMVGTRMDLQEALDFAARGKVKCNVEVRKFSEVNTALDDLRAQKIQGRVVLSIP